MTTAQPHIIRTGAREILMPRVNSAAGARRYADDIVNGQDDHTVEPGRWNVKVKRAGVLVAIVVIASDGIEY